MKMKNEEKKMNFLPFYAIRFESQTDCSLLTEFEHIKSMKYHKAFNELSLIIKALK